MGFRTNLLISWQWLSFWPPCTVHSKIWDYKYKKN